MLTSLRRFAPAFLALSAASCADDPSLCEARSGGALITFDVAGETLSVWITDAAFIGEAHRLLDAGERRIPSFATLHDGTDCDPQWGWHVDPEDVEWADFTIELCDGRPSDIEADEAYWLGTVGQYCPWGAEILSIDDRRED
jgi:hypothetical protein